MPKMYYKPYPTFVGIKLIRPENASPGLEMAVARPEKLNIDDG
jgi:hypothetical protein